jgi:hypothetical protein
VWRDRSSIVGLPCVAGSDRLSMKMAFLSASAEGTSQRFDAGATRWDAFGVLPKTSHFLRSEIEVGVTPNGSEGPGARVAVRVAGRSAMRAQRPALLSLLRVRVVCASQEARPLVPPPELQFPRSRSG